MFNKKPIIINCIILLTILGISMPVHAVFGSKFKSLKAKNNNLYIPIKDINDGKAHYFKTESNNGIMVEFFVVKSPDGVIRAAIDACDVCYKSGKGYIQEGNVMICTNCGRRFATDRINEVKGGCNPAPLMRTMDKKNLVISMKDINANSWYCKYK
ncbi:MAG: DUF2318 domain-containing protein [Desulfobacula sp.]|nr:DUF2318 domain-containing protein [Desulfobacula sp.]